MISAKSVSILIPCYNAERWIAQAIQSALDQTWPDKEIIVVDDGSTDGSLEVIKSFGDQIQFEAGPNRGGNVARNRLLEMASGEWLQYLDADDYLKPGKIKNQLNVANKSSPDVVYSPVLIEQWNNGRVSKQWTSTVDPSQTLEEQWIRWQVAQTGSVIWRKSSLEDIVGWNEDFPCCQDNEVTFRAIKAGLIFQYCPMAEAVYRIWSEDTVCRKDPRRVVDARTLLLDEMLDWLDKNQKISQQHKKAAGIAFFEMARTLAKTDMASASEYVQERLKHGNFEVTGPAGPRLYQLAYQMFGFKNAELIAHYMRNGSSN